MFFQTEPLPIGYASKSDFVLQLGHELNWYNMETFEMRTPNRSVGTKASAITN